MSGSTDVVVVPVEVVQEARKHLLAASILADGYDKHETAIQFRRVRDLLGDALFGDAA